MTKKAAKKRLAKPPAKRTEPLAPAGAPERSHRQRFEQLLDDVVLGVPPKR
jgi:hypothetical protein